MKNPNTSMVSKVVWPWRRGTNTQKKKGAWKRALLEAIFISIFATLIFYLDHTLEATVIWTTAFLLFISSIVLPKIHLKIESYGQSLIRMFSSTLVRILLTFFYYFLFWPCSLLFKTGMSNHFSHEFPGENESYWVSRTGSNASVDDYKRQY